MVIDLWLVKYNKESLVGNETCKIYVKHPEIGGALFFILYEKGYKKDEETIDYYLNVIEIYSNYIDNEIGNLQTKNSEVMVFF